MKYNREIMINIINDNISSVEDLVSMLEITIEDIVKRFPDKLKENWYKFAGDYLNNNEQDDFQDDEEN